MKTIPKLKSLVAASAFALLANASPAFSQTTADDPAQPADTQMRQSTTADEGAIVDEPAGAATDSGNWSWIGLLGLAGLFGLKRHNDVQDERYRTVRT